LAVAFQRVTARIGGAREPAEVQAMLDDAAMLPDTYLLRGLADLGSATLRAKLAGGGYGLWQGYNVETISQRAKERLLELEAPELRAAREASAAAEVDARQLMADLRRVNERAALAGGGGPGPLAGLGDTTVQTPTAKGFRTERSNEFSELGEG